MLTLHGAGVDSEGLGDQHALPAQPALPDAVGWPDKLLLPLWGSQCFHKLWRPGSSRSPAPPPPPFHWHWSQIQAIGFHGLIALLLLLDLTLDGFMVMNRPNSKPVTGLFAGRISFLSEDIRKPFCKGKAILTGDFTFRKNTTVWVFFFSVGL